MKSIVIAAALSALVLSGGTTSALHGAAALDPKITGIVPEKPTVSPKAVTVVINGEEFQSGLSLQVTTPGGDVRTLAGMDITGQKAVSFQVQFTFDAEGRYSFVVLNHDGKRSAPFTLEARRVANRPNIDQVAPMEFSKSPEPQVVTLTGRNFQAGLKLSITDPTGTVTVADRIDKIDAQAVVVRLVFEQSGSYALMVTNPSGESSNTVSLSVR
jgi:hypothetical protein